MDKLDGRITGQFFEQQSAAWRSEQDPLQRKAAPGAHEDAIDIMQLTSKASQLFARRPAR
jgi:hypothetical protein